MLTQGLEARLKTMAAVQQLLHDCPPGRIDRAIDDALALIGSACHADRAYVFQIRDRVFLNNTHEWCAEGIRPFKGELQQIPFYAGEMMWSAFEKEGAMLLPDIGVFPVGSEFRQMLSEQGIQSLVSVPVMQGGEITGFVGLDYCRARTPVGLPEKYLLQSCSTALVAAFEAHRNTRSLARLQAELRSATDRLTAMLREAPEVLMELDREGLVVAFQPAASWPFALDGAEILGKPAQEFFSPGGALSLREAMGQAEHAGRSETLSYPLWIDGDERRFALYVMRRPVARNVPREGYLLVVRDVTQSALQDRTVRQLVRVAEVSSNLIFLTDARRLITWMNPACVLRSGVALDEGLGRKPSEILRLADAAPDTAHFLCAALDRGESADLEIEALTKTGIPYWVHLTAQPLCDATGAHEGFMIVARDITSEKLAAARALRERSNTMDALLEAIALVQPDGRFIYMNSALRSFFGLSPETPSESLYWHEITPDGFNQQLTRLLPTLYKTGGWHGEVELPGPKGGARQYDISLAVQDDGSFLLIARDITARKAAIREQTLLREQLLLAHSRQLVAQLAGGLAHDVANTLAAISQVLASVKPTRHRPTVEALGRIDMAVTQAQALVHNLSRLGQRREARRVFDLRQIVQQAADLLRPGLGSGAQIRLELPEQPLELCGDETSVIQVVLNLLLNARDALGPAPAGDARITLRLRPKVVRETPGDLALGHVIEGQPYIIIEVEDTGAGMTTEQKAAMFRPYFTTKGHDGIGLGLSVVAEILRSNLAAAEVESAPGLGTTLRLFWPVTPLEAAAPDEAPPTPAPALAGASILLVDDDDAVLQQMSKVLAAAGAEVASCIDPRDALATIRAEPQAWDVVVTDFDMGTMSGVELACALHKIRRSLAIILVTGGDLGHASSTPALLREHFEFILQKPVAEPQLVAVTLASILRKSRNQPSDGQAPDATAHSR